MPGKHRREIKPFRLYPKSIDLITKSKMFPTIKATALMVVALMVVALMVVALMVVASIGGFHLLFSVVIKSTTETPYDGAKAIY